MRLLVTGASGFVGAHLMPALAQAFPDAELIGCGEARPLERLDITDHAGVRRLVARTRPQGVVHLAAIAIPAEARRDPARAWAVNHGGTVALAHALAAQGGGPAFVLASSSEVYGRSFGAAPLGEDAPLAPLTPYAATKAAADLAVAAIPGLAAVRLRAFNHTGPGQSAAFVVPAFARQICRIALGRQAPVMTVGRLDTARDFLDVRDVARAYVLSLRHALGGGRGAFNIASGTARPIGDVLAALLALAAVAPRIVPAAGERAADVLSPCGDAARARAVLGWQPAIAWPTTLADVLADWRERVRDEPREPLP
ncbi:MAG: GDP-mannose 4,6-dehydratase [Rhodospirillales bacterium]|nr:GDP-mannose 4,6-dehydratase [Rhodospirillales bacterium]